MSEKTKQGVSDALSDLWAFERENRYWHAMGTPFLINTGRSVEIDADPDCIQVFVYVDDQFKEKVFLETDHFLKAVDSGKKVYTYKIDDGNNNGVFITRRIEIRPSDDDGTFLLFAAEKDGSTWRALGGTTRPGCWLSRHEYNTLVNYAEVQHAYGQAHKINNAAEAEEKAKQS